MESVVLGHSGYDYIGTVSFLRTLSLMTRHADAALAKGNYTGSVVMKLRG